MATSESVSVKEFAERAFIEAGFTKIRWEGEGTNEKLIDLSNDKILL